jgi:hypothetical protein
MEPYRDNSEDAAQRRRPDGKKNGEDAPLLAEDGRRASEESEETPLLVTGSSESDDEAENEFMKPINYNEWDHLPWWKRPSVCLAPTSTVNERI